MAHQFFGPGNNNEIFPDELREPFYDQMVPTVVFIDAGNDHCCGGVVVSGDRVLTIYSRVRDATQMKVSLFSGENCNAEIVNFSEESNLALLELDKSNLDFAQITQSEIFIAQTVHAIGHAHPFKFEYNQGYVSNLNITFSQVYPMVTDHIPSNIKSLQTLPYFEVDDLVLERFEYDDYNESFTFGTPLFDSRGFIIGLFNFWTSTGFHYFISPEKLREFIAG